MQKSKFCVCFEVHIPVKLKFGSLFLKIKKKLWQEKRVSLIYWERETSLVSEMHLRVYP